MSIQTENKNGTGIIDQAISLPVATPELMETKQTARHMLQVTVPSALPEVRDTTIYQFVNDHLSYLTYRMIISSHRVTILMCSSMEIV